MLWHVKMDSFMWLIDRDVKIMEKNWRHVHSSEQWAACLGVRWRSWLLTTFQKYFKLKSDRCDFWWRRRNFKNFIFTSINRILGNEFLDFLELQKTFHHFETAPGVLVMFFDGRTSHKKLISEKFKRQQLWRASGTPIKSFISENNSFASVNVSFLNILMSLCKQKCRSLLCYWNWSYAHDFGLKKMPRQLMSSDFLEVSQRKQIFLIKIAFFDVASLFFNRKLCKGHENVYKRLPTCAREKS